jgi:hypothetical protein
MLSWELELWSGFKAPGCLKGELEWGSSQEARGRGEEDRGGEERTQDTAFPPGHCGQRSDIAVSRPPDWLLSSGQARVKWRCLI